MQGTNNTFIKQILDGKMPAPRTMELHLSNVCNHACVGCHSHHQHQSQHKFLDFDKMKEIVTELAELGVEGVEISGGGPSRVALDRVGYARG